MLGWVQEATLCKFSSADLQKMSAHVVHIHPNTLPQVLTAFTVNCDTQSSINITCAESINLLINQSIDKQLSTLANLIFRTIIMSFFAIYDCSSFDFILMSILLLFTNCYRENDQ